MSDTNPLIEQLSTYETQADIVVRAKDQAADAKSQADSAKSELITLASQSGVTTISQIAKAIRECEFQIQEIIDNPGGVTELKEAEKTAQAAFYATVERGVDASTALTSWRKAQSDTNAKSSEAKNLNKIRNTQIKNLLSAVKTLY